MHADGNKKLPHLEGAKFRNHRGVGWRDVTVPKKKKKTRYHQK